MGRWGLSLVVAFAVAGCGPETKQIRGDWTLTAGHEVCKMTFNGNGTYTALYEFQGKQVTLNGRFAQSGTWIYFTPESIKASDKELQKSYDEFGHLPRSSFRTKWLDEETVQLLNDEVKRPQTLKRVRPRV